MLRAGDDHAAARSPRRTGHASFWTLFGSIFLLVGLPFVLLAGYFVMEEHQLAANGRVVEALVLTRDISRSGSNVTRSVTYRFDDADGRVIQGRSNVDEPRWSSLTERGPVDVVYLPHRSSVNRLVGASERVRLLIFAAVGCVLSLAGGTIVVLAVRQARMRRRLLTAGVRAPATVADVRPMNLRLNGRTQSRLTYEYRDFQARAHRRTQYLDADEASRWKAGDAGEVLFDPDDPDQALWL